MKHKRLSINPFQEKKSSRLSTIVIIAGIAIGVVGTLIATKKGRALKGKVFDFTGNLLDQLRGNTRAKANIKLGKVISDVRTRIKQNAEGIVANY